MSNAESEIAHVGFPNPAMRRQSLKRGANSPPGSEFKSRQGVMNKVVVDPQHCAATSVPRLTVEGRRCNLDGRSS